MNIAHDDHKVIAFNDRKVIASDGQKVLARATKVGAARCYFKPPLPATSVVLKSGTDSDRVSRRELQNANGR